MGKNSTFLKSTADTLRRIANEADKNYAKAEEALSDAEASEARTAQREAGDLSDRCPALRGR